MATDDQIQRLDDSMRALAARVRAGTISLELFNLLFGASARASGMPMSVATEKLNAYLGDDAALLTRLR